MRWNTKRLVVEASRHDHTHSGLFRHFRRELDIPPEFHWAGIDKSRHPESFDFLQFINRLRYLFFAFETGVIELKAGKPRREMFVNEGEAEILRFTGSEDR